MEITRRDFLNGFALAIAAALGPFDQLARAEEGSYPPGLTGLRGSHDRVIHVAHQLGREGKRYSLDNLPVDESYDLVVVGAGLAGLSAAWFFKQQNPSAKILILDNHDDFGGHATRCELEAGGRLLLGYGGSESMVSPRTMYASAAHRRLLRGLKVDPKRFVDERMFHRRLYPSLGLSRAIFFDRESFGVDKLVTGDPNRFSYDEFAAPTPNARPIAAFLADCPLTPAARDGLLALYNGTKDHLGGMPKQEKLALLKKTSYRDFLLQTAGLPKDAADYFQGRSNDNVGLGIDAIAAFDAMGGGFPGAKALGLTSHDLEAEEEEPYVHHYPDGNASLARLMVCQLVPGVAPGSTMDDIVTARFDYTKLDLPAAPVRIRLRSTAVVAQNETGRVAIGYVRDGELRRVAAQRCVLATYGMVMPHICPEMPPEQKTLLAGNVKSPLVYTKVLSRSWESWQKLRVHSIAAPMSFHTTVKLDYPVSLGSYRFPRHPHEPIGLQLVHVPLVPNQGLSAREQCRAGRERLLEMTFADFEMQIRADLDRMLGPGGFDAKRDILAITVNRWAHGYSYSFNSLYDDVDAAEASMEKARAPVGRIALANSDTAWDAYAHAAIAEAARAVDELARL